MSIHHANGAVKTSRTLDTLHTRRYLVPGTEHEERPRTAAVGFFDAGVLRSVRSSDGRRYDGDEIALLVEIMEQAERDGLSALEVVIHYRKTQAERTYRTDFDTLRRYGRRVLGVSGWELALPLCHWSIDGQPPAGEGATPNTPEAPATQPALFQYTERVVYL